MSHLYYVKQKKQNTFGVHWLWSVFVLSWLIAKERCQSIIVYEYSQKKSCYNLELDSEVSSKKEAISRERKEVSEYIVDETVLKAGSENIWLWVATEWTRKWSISRTNHIKREEHVCSRKVSVKHRQRLWKTCCIYRWRYMVSTSLWIYKNRTSHPFFFREKPDWKEDAISKIEPKVSMTISHAE